jgi:hypothetical protein
MRDDINIPHSYGTIRDGAHVGIILEDLRKHNGTFGSDFNNDINKYYL